MFSVGSLVTATTKRVTALTVASAFLLAAGQVPSNDMISLADVALDQVSFESPSNGIMLAIDTEAASVAADAEIAAMVQIAEPQLTILPDNLPSRLDDMVASITDAQAKVGADADLKCLARAVYFESRGEPLEGQLAVAQAILNRTESGRYAKSACAVISQPGQFSYPLGRNVRPGSDWAKAQAIAVIAAQELWHEVAPEAMSFHATYVKPGWTDRTRVAQIGRHIFYR
jgi:hypothetical protein